MTDPQHDHFPIGYLAQPNIQAAIDQRRAEVRDLAGQVRQHLEAGCPAGSSCPGSPVIRHLGKVCDHHRFDITVAALILLAERDMEIKSLRLQLGIQGAV